LQCPLNITRTTSSRRSCADAADGGEEEEEEKEEEAEEVNWINSRQEEFKTRLTDIGITAIRNVALPLTPYCVEVASDSNILLPAFRVNQTSKLNDSSNRYRQSS
jgi:hypothetical protein